MAPGADFLELWDADFGKSHEIRARLSKATAHFVRGFSEALAIFAP